MGRKLVFFACTVALAILAVLGDSTEVRAGLPADIKKEMRRGRPRKAMKNIADAMEIKADAPDLFASLAWNLSRLGFMRDALTTFQFARGSSWYEERAISSHADALRAAGHGREAAALRLSVRVAPTGPAAERLALLYAADDLRAAGDPGAAVDLAEEAIAIQPTSSFAYAVLADAHLDLGESEEADFCLWLAFLQPSPSARAYLVEVRRDLALGDIISAQADARDARNKAPSNTATNLTMADILRRRGDFGTASELLEPRVAPFGDRPEFLVEKAWLLRDEGHIEAAQEIVDRARAEYPDNQAMIRALASWDR